MKGLFSVFGLIAALFVSNVYAVGLGGGQNYIFNTVEGVAPKISSVPIYLCKGTSGGYYDRGGADGCLAFLAAQINNANSYYNAQCEAVPSLPELGKSTRVECSHMVKRDNADDYGVTGKYMGQVYYQKNINSKSCPPDTAPRYGFGYDSNFDGEIDKCYDPVELHNASQCMNQFNNLLPKKEGAPSNVCYTNPETGAKCAYSDDGGSNGYYSLNIAGNCFDGSDVPEYEDPEKPNPKDEECQKYNEQMFVCAADPQDYCDAQGVCADGCGYVNDQFVCFRPEECTGPDCKQPTEEECTGDDCEEKPPEECTGDDCEEKPPTEEEGETKDFDYNKLSSILDRALAKAVGLITDKKEMPDPDAEKSKLDALFEDVSDKESELHDDKNYKDFKDSFDGSMFDGLKSFFPPVGTCQPIDFVIGTLDYCQAADIVRMLLANFFYGLTFFYMFSVFNARFTRSKS